MRQRINRVQVGRVGDGDGDLVFIFEDGDDAVFSCDVTRDDGNDLVFNFHAAELDDFRAELRGLGLRHVRRADDVVGQQQIHHAHAGGLGLRASLGDLPGVCEAEVHQQIHKIVVFFSHGFGTSPRIFTGDSKYYR